MSEQITIKISLPIFERLQKVAVPLIDTPDTVIERLLDDLESHQNESSTGNGSQNASGSRLWNSSRADFYPASLNMKERVCQEQDEPHLQPEQRTHEAVEFNRLMRQLEEVAFHDSLNAKSETDSASHALPENNLEAPGDSLPTSELHGEPVSPQQEDPGQQLIQNVHEAAGDDQPMPMVQPDEFAPQGSLNANSNVDSALPMLQENSQAVMENDMPSIELHREVANQQLYEAGSQLNHKPLQIEEDNRRLRQLMTGLTSGFRVPGARR